ncbi:MAG TPA: hydantoinase/oxoprolinase family protein [Dissulfurispiraceae bacterium]|nr:hydantoinase/oxoprolinase family protein [Dissulfurispiraceae bacterium]
MRIGLDAGGTHLDAVLLDESGVRATAKVPTNHSSLIESVLEALSEILRTADTAKIECINLSTTLSTNALLEGKTDPVGVIVSGGPGIDPSGHRIGDDYHVVDGAIDHRGKEIIPLDGAQLQRAIAVCRERSIDAFAVVAKFSPRNPAHEQHMEASLEGSGAFITAGHRLSGRLNFPRRITTAYFNSAVSRVFSAFADAVEAGVRKLTPRSRINVLKADGGTMSLSDARARPVQSILSGPSASVLGIIGLCDIAHDAVLLDIGGTTTDIALLAEGTPLLVPDGIMLCGRLSCVRALLTKSIPVGGDSLLSVHNGEIAVGPERKGPCMALGGPAPTLMDACNHLGLSALGNTKASSEGLCSLGGDPSSVARSAFARAIDAVHRAATDLLSHVNERPVYTVYEVLHPVAIAPRHLYIVGGPAKPLAPALEDAFQLPVTVPVFYTHAGALGAAAARTTRDIELFADTERGVKIIPQLSLTAEASSSYALPDAERDARELLCSMIAGQGDAVACDVQVLSSTSFNMIRNGRLAGKNIRVQCQLRPGLVDAYRAAMRGCI